MTRSSAGSIAVSAPGKVLLAGGYLVLDRDYTGLVFGLNARILAHVSPVRTSEGVVLSEIVVKSPQFTDAIWEYGYRLAHGEAGVLVTELRADADIKLKKNPFIQTALSYALSYISAHSTAFIPSAHVTILADNSYYSTIGATLSASHRYHSFAVPLDAAHKTGLGSSAALVTAFTAALLQFYLPRGDFDLATPASRRRLHNLAQAAHCAAQGKVGSGFDVASAVHGSCVYRRFSPALLAGVGDPGSKGFAARLRALVDDDQLVWDTEIHKNAVKVPAGLQLVMCDVRGGSQTPGMVKEVLRWRTAHAEEADALWRALQVANTQLAEELVRLSGVATETGGSSSRDYGALKERLRAIRQLVRTMGGASGVAIEPPEQTRLIDECCRRVPGVVGGVVPGAGGYDAIALLVEDRQEVLDGLRRLFEDLHTSGGAAVSVLDVREELEGVRLEDPAAFDGWTP